MEKGIKYPQCLGGKNACPPKDCGGPWGYAHLLSVVNDQKTKEGKEIRERLGLSRGEKINPATFDPNEVSFQDPKTVLLRNKKMGMFD